MSPPIGLIQVLPCRSRAMPGRGSKRPLAFIIINKSPSVKWRRAAGPPAGMRRLFLYILHCPWQDSNKTPKEEPPHAHPHVPVPQKKEPSAAMRRQQELLADLRDTKCRLDAARNFFESVSDPDLVSAAVYQIDALQAQYCYLLIQAKKHKVDAQSLLRQ